MLSKPQISAQYWVRCYSDIGVSVWNCLASGTKRRLWCTAGFAPAPICPMKTCLQWILQRGHKMVFLSSVLDASPFTPSFMCPIFILPPHRSSKYPSFPSELISAPQHAHIAPLPHSPLSSSLPPFLTHPSCIRHKKKKKNVTLSPKRTQSLLINRTFGGNHVGQNRTWMHFAQCALGQGWKGLVCFFQSKMTPCLCF